MNWIPDDGAAPYTPEPCDPDGATWDPGASAPDPQWAGAGPAPGPDWDSGAPGEDPDWSGCGEKGGTPGVRIADDGTPTPVLVPLLRFQGRVFSVSGGEAQFDFDGRYSRLGHTHAWGAITGKPEVFPPAAHTHAWGAITGKPEVFPPAAHTHTWGAIEEKPAAFPPAAHTHTWGAIEEKPAAFPPIAHRHKWGEIDDAPADFPTAPHALDGSLHTGTLGMRRVAVPTESAVMVGYMGALDALEPPDGAGPKVLSARGNTRPEWIPADWTPGSRQISTGVLSGLAGGGSLAGNLSLSINRSVVDQWYSAYDHRHPWSDLIDPPATATRWPAWGEVTGKPVAFPPEGHSFDFHSGNLFPDRIEPGATGQVIGMVAGRPGWTTIPGQVPDPGSGGQGRFLRSVGAASWGWSQVVLPNAVPHGSVLIATADNVVGAMLGLDSSVLKTDANGRAFWGLLTPAEIGAAEANHTHNASAINAGTLALARLPVAASGASSSTQVVRADDSRLSNARTPIAHALNDLAYHTGNLAVDRLAPGAAGQVIGMIGTNPGWVNVPGGVPAPGTGAQGRFLRSTGAASWDWSNVILPNNVPEGAVLIGAANNTVNAILGVDGSVLRTDPNGRASWGQLTAAEVGALPLAGGTLGGALAIAGSNSSTIYARITRSGAYLGAGNPVAIELGASNDSVDDNGRTYRYRWESQSTRPSVPGYSLALKQMLRGGAERLIYHVRGDNGYIGIGTATPGHQLDVTGTARVSGAITAATFYKS